MMFSCWLSMDCDEWHSSLSLFCEKASTWLLLLRLLDIAIVIV